MLYKLRGRKHTYLSGPYVMNTVSNCIFDCLKVQEPVRIAGCYVIVLNNLPLQDGLIIATHRDHMLRIFGELGIHDV